MVYQKCINLRERFGDRYRVKLESPAKSWADPWYQFIPCQHGHIHPHGGDQIGFASNKRGPVAKRVADLPFASVTQDGDDGVNIVFPVDRFDEVARIVKPRRRKRLTEDQKIVAARNLTPFSKKTVAEAAETGRETSREALGDWVPA